jgi:hypothetical protein
MAAAKIGKKKHSPIPEMGDGRGITVICTLSDQFNGGRRERAIAKRSILVPPSEI